MKYIGIDVGNGSSQTVTTHVFNQPRSGTKPRISEMVHNGSLCKEIVLGAKMRSNHQRLHDKVIDAAHDIRNEIPNIFERISDLKHLRKDMGSTGMYLLTEYINIAAIRKQLSNQYQARCIKYALYALFLEQWIHEEKDWKHIRQVIHVSFSLDKNHIRLALSKILAPRAKLMGKHQEISQIIEGR